MNQPATLTPLPVVMMAHVPLLMQWVFVEETVMKTLMAMEHATILKILAVQMYSRATTTLLRLRTMALANTAHAPSTVTVVKTASVLQ